MLASIQAGTVEDECLQRGRVDGIALMEIDGTYRLAVQTRVEHSPFGSLSWAPFGNVSLTAFLRASPMQMTPSWDQTGTPSGREGFFHFTSSITPGSAPLIRARSWPSLSPLQPAVFRTMASICWDADASFMPMLCRGGSAPSGPKGSVPCPFDACSQANNTAADFPPAVRIAIAGCAGFSFR